MPRIVEKILKWCKFHNKDCVWSPKSTTCVQRQKEMRMRLQQKIVTPATKRCIGECGRMLPAQSFHKDYTTLTGLKGSCKECVSKRDYARGATWKGYVQKKVVCSWKSHGNKSVDNKLSIEEAFKLLEDQKYICNHCSIPLECTRGTPSKTNHNGASLDRKNTDIIGYGNGNAQWLCISCNNGKNTMADQLHKEKFLLRDNRIRYLEEQLALLGVAVEPFSVHKQHVIEYELNFIGEVIEYELNFFNEVVEYELNFIS